MEHIVLLKANFKQHKDSLISIFFLVLIACIALGTVLSVWTNSQSYIKSEINRAGFGDLTAWINSNNAEDLINDITNLSDIQKVETQNIIYSNYTIKGQKSDSEGQLIIFDPLRYKFFKDDFSNYESTPKINSGEIYISPSLISIFDVKIGDEISFSVARQNKNAVFTVKGFYEDPFMGSSMIGMKGFIICETDYKEITSTIQSAGIDALARLGAMLHIFIQEYSKITISEINRIINENTDLYKYTEFIYSENAISGFMLILQNAFSGLLIAFVFVLFCTTAIVLSHNISSMIETDYTNIGILKAVGFTNKTLQQTQLIQYLVSIITGVLFGFAFAIFFSNFISKATLTTTGVLIPTKLPLKSYSLFFVLILIFFSCFIILKTRKITHITPIKVILNKTETTYFNFSKCLPIYSKFLNIHLAIRQLVTGKRKYISVCIVATFLVFFTSVVGYINTWLGADGKGMMDAFNPADHDIGVQVFGNTTPEEIEDIILSYANITDSYLLAMPTVSVNGINYKANVISEAERFHIIQGKTCIKDNEIVLTKFVADDLGVSIGDTISINGDIGNNDYIVSGIYQCANDMGNNVGMSQKGYLKIGQDNPYMWCYHYFLNDTSQKHIIIQTLEDSYGGDIYIHENSWPGLFGIISTMRTSIIFMYIIVIVFILIVTIISSNKILSSEQKNLGIYKSIGFSTKQLRLTFVLRFNIVAIVGSLLGTILANFFTNPLVSSIMKFAGISNFVASPDIITNLFPTIVVILSFTCFAYFISGKIKNVDLTTLIVE